MEATIQSKSVKWIRNYCSYRVIERKRRALERKLLRKLYAANHTEAGDLVLAWQTDRNQLEVSEEEINDQVRKFLQHVS